VISAALLEKFQTITVALLAVAHHACRLQLEKRNRRIAELLGRIFVARPHLLIPHVLLNVLSQLAPLITIMLWRRLIYIAY